MEDALFLYTPWTAFILGACFGSFLNVVFYRYPLGKSVVSPGSACPNCNHNLAWYDNVPVFGWLMLRGKCRYCKTPISARYPFYEFLFGLAGAVAIVLHPHNPVRGLALAGLAIGGIPMLILLARVKKAPWYLTLVSTGCAGLLLWDVLIR